MKRPAGNTPALDPFAAGSGRYVDDLVEVRAMGELRQRRTLGMVRTPHFDVTHQGSRVRIDHRLPRTALHGGLADVLAEELFGPGWLRGSDLFERIFTGVVLSSAPEPLAGWEAFYRNSLGLIDAAIHDGPDRATHGTIADFAPIYTHAESLLLSGSVLELGSCFGFLSLRLAAAEREVVAVDIEPGRIQLLAAVADRLGLGLRTVPADAANVPLPDRSIDTVVALHLMEHLDAEQGDRVLRDALRLATRRVVVAVPLEDEPEETWGHVRTVSLADLDAWGRATGLSYDVHEHHGGWLVLDRAS